MAVDNPLSYILNGELYEKQESGRNIFILCSY
jgi:hypothetical protein